MKAETFQLSLVEAILIAPGVRHLVFKRSDDQILHYTPGHFINFHLLRDDKIVRRSYSIASLTNNGLLEIAVSFVPEGFASKFFSQLQPGDQVEASGPFGRLCLRDEPVQRYLLVATGTGITPYRAMINTLLTKLANDPLLSVTVIGGSRTKQEALYQQDFVDAAEASPRFHYFACYSREDQQKKLLSYERLGHVQNTLAELAVNAQNDIVYLCGNPMMIDDTFNWLQTKGFAVQQVRREKYISNAS